MSLDTIVSLSIDRKTSTPSVKSFTTPLLVGYHTRWVQRVKKYGSPDEMLPDGFALTDKLYRDAVALFSQTPRPAEFKVGRRATAFTQTLDITPVDTTPGKVHTIKWNEQTFTYTNGGSETPTTIVTALFTASAGITGGTRTNGTTKLTITASVAGKVNEVEISAGLEVKDVTTDPGLTADLNAIRAEDADWYAFTIDSNSEPEVLAAAAWADARVVLFGAVSSDSELLKSVVTTDVASDLAAASRTRTFGIFRRKVGNTTMPAWISRCITVNPGKINWAFKNLVGETVDVLSTAEESAIQDKRFSHYQKTGGLNVTFDGRTPKANEYVDLVVSTDWIHARVQEAVFGHFANNDIVPYTENGIESVKGVVFTTLQRYAASENYPILDPISLEVSVPKLEETSVADRAARKLPNVSFSGRFQGALNSVVIKGSIYL